MFMSDLVSVIIPTYNRADYIGETIESVLNQTYSPLEIIVIDDGSTDKTREVVANYLPRVRYIWQENAERGAARNHGLRIASGKFIAFLDSDDVWLPNKIEEDLKIFNSNPEAGLVYSDIQIIGADGKLKRELKREKKTGWVTEHLLRKNFVSVGAHLIRTQILRDIGGFREERQLSCSEDYETWVRLSTFTQFTHQPSATAKIRVHPNNSVKNIETSIRAVLYACDLFEKEDYLTANQKKLVKKTRAWVTLNNSLGYASTNQKREAINLLKQSFKYNSKIVFEPLFTYSILKIIVGERVSDAFYFLNRSLKNLKSILSKKPEKM